MTDRLTKGQRSRLMGRIQGGPRNKLQRSVHGWLCATHVRHECEPDLGGIRPDFAIHPRAGPRYPILLVFVDGCFWHGCPSHYREPKSNAEYWRRHIADNVARDARRKDLTYPYIEIWEHGVTGGRGWPRGAYKPLLKQRVREAYAAHDRRDQAPLEVFAGAAS